MTGIINEMYLIISTEAQALPIEPELANQFAQNLIIKLCNHYGGIPVYLPKSKDLTTRNALIWSKFTGNNHIELCREFNLSYQQICKIIGIQRKKRQGDLFA